MLIFAQVPVSLEIRWGGVVGKEGENFDCRRVSVGSGDPTDGMTIAEASRRFVAGYYGQLKRLTVGGMLPPMPVAKVVGPPELALLVAHTLALMGRARVVSVYDSKRNGYRVVETYIPAFKWGDVI